MSEPKSINLFFTEGSSDKVYNAQLEQRADGWAVAFQYGRRGKPLTAGEKGTGLDYAKAVKIYDKLVGEKVAKGYTEAETGIAFSSAALAGQVTGYQPQLLNEIDPEEARALGPDWLVQEKHDGERRGLLADDAGRRFANRRGLEVGVQTPIAEAFTRLHEIVGPMVLDAEDMGAHAVIFDVQRHYMIKDGTFRERAAILHHLQKTILDAGLGEALIVDVPVPADVFFATQEAGLREGGAEGYVLRHADSLYTAGRPASGGSALKVKYWEDATCRVTEGRDGKRSVGLELLDSDGAWVAVGNVTVPPSIDLPVTGSLIDVKYLYAYPGGSLFQPTFKGVRTDIPESDCRIDRLKLKGAGPKAEEEAPEFSM